MGSEYSKASTTSDIRTEDVEDIEVKELQEVQDRTRGKKKNKHRVTFSSSSSEYEYGSEDLLLSEEELSEDLSNMNGGNSSKKNNYEGMEIVPKSKNNSNNIEKKSDSESEKLLKVAPRVTRQSKYRVVDDKEEDESNFLDSGTSNKSKDDNFLTADPLSSSSDSPPEDVDDIFQEFNDNIVIDAIAQLPDEDEESHLELLNEVEDIQEITLCDKKGNSDSSPKPFELVNLNNESEEMSTSSSAKLKGESENIFSEDAEDDSDWVQTENVSKRTRRAISRKCTRRYPLTSSDDDSSGESRKKNRFKKRDRETTAPRYNLRRRVQEDRQANRRLRKKK